MVQAITVVGHLKKLKGSGAGQSDSERPWQEAGLKLLAAWEELAAAAARAQVRVVTVAGRWPAASDTRVPLVTAQRPVTAARVKVLMGEQASSRVRHIQPERWAPGWGQYATLKLKPEC